MPQSKKKERSHTYTSFGAWFGGRGALVLGMDARLTWESCLHGGTTMGGEASTWRDTDIVRAVDGLWRRARPYLWRNNVGRGDACVEA